MLGQFSVLSSVAGAIHKSADLHFLARFHASHHFGQRFVGICSDVRLAGGEEEADDAAFHRDRRAVGADCRRWRCRCSGGRCGCDATSTAPDIGGQNVQLLGRELAVPSRHHPGAAIGDHVGHVGLDRRAVDKDAARQVRGAQCLVAFAVGAMAGRAHGELRLAKVGANRIVGAVGQAHHVVGQVADVVRRPDSRAHGRHDGHPALGDRLVDLLGRAAPGPVVVRQVGKALAAASVRSMTLGAIVHEQAVTNGHGLRVFRQGLDRLASEAGIDRCHLFVTALNLTLELTGLRPLQRALVRTQARVQIQIDQAENTGNDEQTDPPARQRVVHLAQVAIPHMTGGVAGMRHGLGLATEPQQGQTSQNTRQRDASDVNRPEVTRKVAHFLFLDRRAQFSSNGSRAASSN